MARPYTQSDDGEGHKCSHEREINRDPQKAQAREEHECLSAQPQAGLTGRRDSSRVQSTIQP
jgi:hypothetical protein